jgi:hypothetical protein
VALLGEEHKIHCDNAKDFRGTVIGRACRDHNITVARQANIDSRFARNARVIAKAADPFDTLRQVVVRELICCINRVPHPQIKSDTFVVRK